MKNFSISIIMIFCLQLILAQKDKISLYPEGIPCKSNLETELDYDSSGRIFKKVSDPEIWYYPSDKMKGKENNVAVLVIPGGGYWGLWFDKEGVDVAKWLNNIGVSAFVLKHRLPHWESKDCRSKVALMDAQRAMRIIRKNSKIWNIDSNKIGVLGFSAGGHLASTLSTHHDNGLDLSDLEIEQTSSRPDFSILVYPVITMNRPYAHNGSRENLLGKIPSQEYLDYYSNDLQVREDTPPAILIHSDDDKGVLPENSIQYYLALRKYNIPAALHIWEDGGHGYGLGNDKGSIKSWARICEEWMIQREIINL
ncbi:MAG: hypothetical protein CMC91_06440 [Flavobacteriaceae bacterium]|nr:hypothetical protein [Flavobacteriaceae bacterium]|tara:strand:- start:30716 stop:31645 length:930 start_codon:yes stop_codon:yes gene_type:complete